MKPWEPWPGEPDKCRCTRLYVETIDETLGCPRGWRWLQRARLWVHA
jgi:hypothetical protein